MGFEFLKGLFGGDKQNEAGAAEAGQADAGASTTEAAEAMPEQPAESVGDTAQSGEASPTEEPKTDTAV